MYLLFHNFNYDVLPILREMTHSQSLKFEGSTWNNISEGAKHVMEFMLQYDPAKRSTSKEILNHPWFSGGTSASTQAHTVLDMMRSYNAERRLKVCQKLIEHVPIIFFSV